MSEDVIAALPSPCAVQEESTWGEAWMVCKRCALAWSPEDPRPPKCAPLNLGRMASAFEAIANQIETSQRILISEGYRQFASHEQMERAQLLRAGVRFLDRLINDDELRRQFQSKRKSDVASRAPEGTG